MKYLLMLVMFAHGAVSAAELRHYDVLVFPYDPDVYQMKETKLTHNSYKSYTLDGSLKAFKRRNTEREGTIHFNIGFFNNIKFDTVDAWIADTEKIIAINQKQGNDWTVIGKGKLGDDTRYLAIADSIIDDGKFGILEFNVGYIRFGRMLTIQVFFQGDTTNEAALKGFVGMINDALHQIVDGDTKPFTGSLEFEADWRDKVKRGK